MTVDEFKTHLILRDFRPHRAVKGMMLYTSGGPRSHRRFPKFILYVDCYHKDKKTVGYWARMEHKYVAMSQHDMNVVATPVCDVTKRSRRQMLNYVDAVLAAEQVVSNPATWVGLSRIEELLAQGRPVPDLSD